jgi:hypothetical protein
MNCDDCDKVKNRADAVNEAYLRMARIVERFSERVEKLENWIKAREEKKK